MRIFNRRITLRQSKKRLADGYAIAHGDIYTRDRARISGPHLGFHFHRFEYANHLALAHSIANVNRYLMNGACEARCYWRRSTPNSCRGGGSRLSENSRREIDRALSHHNLIGMTIYRHRVLGRFRR